MSLQNRLRLHFADVRAGDERSACAGDDDHVHIVVRCDLRIQTVVDLFQNGGAQCIQRLRTINGKVTNVILHFI